MTLPDGLTSRPLTDDLWHGALDLERTDLGVRPHRLPAAARFDADPALLVAEAESSGVRLAFRTAATVIELTARPTRRTFAGGPERPVGAYDLVVDGVLADQQSIAGGTVLVSDPATGKTETRPGEPGTVRFADLAKGTKRIEIWLPHNENTELVGLRADAPLEPIVDGRRRWVHHGSSISHGSNATHPTGIWPAVAAGLAGVDLLNLGYGASCMLDGSVARTIRDLPADVISLKLGINLVNFDVMRLRAFTPAVHAFLDLIRDGHPTTPLLVVTPLRSPTHEDVPGPGQLDPEAWQRGEVRFRATGDPADIPAGRLTLEVIRAELTRIVELRAADDPNLHLLSGLELYGPADDEAHPLPDGLHPDGPTQRLIGERFAERAFTSGGPFGVTAPTA
ncbi:SGNH/GDSL hydrolase family protein [Microlunatus sp. Y2014]|uniref:SGNH/GDSL hydrolase family protein n=1 Tax=Microlunatus sp. Y2014 TaxID=3418488 RepID=UPI003DA77F56